MSQTPGAMGVGQFGMSRLRHHFGFQRRLPRMAPTAQAQIIAYSKPSQSLNKDDLRRMGRLVEGVKLFLRQEARDFLLDRVDSPVAVVYSSDSTPLRTRQRWLIDIEGMLVVRSSRRSDDWLLQRMFLFDGAGNRRSMMVDPVRLLDKSAWSHFQAQRSMFPLPRSVGHRGVVLHHHVWDGAVKSACERATRQLHSAHRTHLQAQLPPSDAHLLDLKSWTTFTLGVLHS